MKIIHALLLVAGSLFSSIATGQITPPQIQVPVSSAQGGTGNANSGSIMFNQNIQFNGPGGTTWTGPYLARTDIAQTFQQNQNFANGGSWGSTGILNTKINGNTLSTGTGTLALGAGKTTTFDHTSTFTTTDAQTYTFPTTSATLARTDAAQTFTGGQTFNNGASNVALTLQTSAGAPYINFQPASTHTYWLIGCQFNLNNGCEITPSTSVGGSTFSTPVVSVLTTGASVTGTFAASGAVTMPGLASSSSATTGSMCWTTSTGNITIDTTLACLSSTQRVKKLIHDLDGSLNTIMALRPVHYELKKENNPLGLGEQVGLIAEEVQKVDDRLVGKFPDGTVAGVRYMQLTAVLVGAIQAQERHIRELWVVAIFACISAISCLFIMARKV